MRWTKRSLANPAAVAVVALIIILLGVMSLFRLPMQLFPDIDRPQITVQTTWRAAAPREVEAEINEPLEDVLQGIPGVQEMVTNAGPGNSFVGLTFALGSDMNKAMLEVISRLNRLPPLPADADPPVVLLGGFTGDAQSLIWYFVQTKEGNDDPISEYRRFLEKTVMPRLEAVPGVASAQVFWASGVEELQIIFDPHKAASLGIDLTDVAARAGRANDVSGGFADVGRRMYTLRFSGRYSPEDLGALILNWRDGRPITLGDIAEVKIGNGRRTGLAYQNGRPATAVQLLKETDANVLATLAEVKRVVAELNATVMAEKGLHMEKSFDPSVFIQRAINLLTGNLVLGILLAFGILWWFLRQMRATLIIALAIPISLLATITVLLLTGRSVNAISLAGMAFATGMVLDAAIVVLENIVRLREKGETPENACDKGASQVWGALLASTATTVAIFLPVMFIEDAEGQLFADLALTIAVAVSFSLLIAVTVLPTAAAHWIRDMPPSDFHRQRWDRVSAWVLRLTGTRIKRLAWIGGLIAGSIVATVLLKPAFDYLPRVQRDAVDTFLRFPAGISLDSVDEEFAQVINARLEPYLKGEKEPALLNYYMIAFPGFFSELAVRALDQSRADELLEVVKSEIMPGFPDLIWFTRRGELFGAFNQSSSIQIHIQSADDEARTRAAVLGVDLITGKFKGIQTFAFPDPSAATPEIRIHPNDRRIAEVGWTRSQLANVIRALGDGLWLGEYFDGEERLDIILKARGWTTPEELENLPLATPSGQIVPPGELATIERNVGPVGILRREGRRTTTLQFAPPRGLALEEIMATLRTEVEPQLRALLPADGNIVYGGSADSFDRAIGSLGSNFLLAMVLLFLLMAALFRSPKDAAMVMISIPLATVGGVAALRMWGLPMDLLTMIGFIILLGLVVNNAILLVVQTRRSEEEGQSREQAVETALRRRLRPIFMSTLTSIFGMLPLMLMPGEGSAIYRGMAAAVVGGMSVSTIFTLILLPSLLRLNFGAELSRLGGHLPQVGGLLARRKGHREPAE